MKIQGIGISPVQNRQNTFKRNWSEHASWGANYVKETGKTNFKLFSFPDAKAVFVEVADKIGTSLGGIKERIVQVFATAGTALTIKPSDDSTKVYPMEHKGNGIYEAKGIEAKPDSKYRYIVVDKDNNINTVKDPYSKKQENINGWSSVYDQNGYEWKNTGWETDPRRITRKPAEKLRGLDNLVIEEVNIPTLSQEGTFESAKSKINEIAQNGVATAVELMPVENTFSMQWGYDGVDKFAVNEKLGGADKLKELIDYTHGKGLNVIMDMVPNHMGPDGDYLSQTGPYEKGSGQFGGEFNYEGENNRYVRDWMTNAALWWTNEFKVDGLRLDMTQLCGSDYLLKQIVTEVNEHNPEVFIIAEDGRENKESVTRYEKRKQVDDHNDDLDFIDTQVDYIARRGWCSTPVNIGFDSEWDFRFKTIMKNAILNPGANLLDSLDDRIKESAYRVKFVMSHDEIGNWDGTRLIPKVMVAYLDLFNKVNGYSDEEKGQKAAQIGQKLCELIVSKDFEELSEKDLADIEKKVGLNSYISKENLINSFKTALAKQKLALGTTMTIPGPKMYFQGDEEGDLSHFKFFREFSGEKIDRAKSDDIKNGIVAQKGYDTLESVARPDSILGRVKPDGVFKDIQTQMQKYTSDLRQLLDKYPALTTGTIESTYKDHNHNVHIHQLKSGRDEILVIKNFGQGFHDKNYSYYGFPQNSRWEELLNSDEKKYGGSGYSNAGRRDITNLNQNLSLAPNSVIILKKIS